MEETTITSFVIYEDGTTERQSYTGYAEDEQPGLSKPGRYVGEPEYVTFLAGINAGNAAHEESLLTLEATTLKGDYDALVALGLPDSAARRMSGYAGT